MYVLDSIKQIAMRTVIGKSNPLFSRLKMGFSGFSGPYNPFLYKQTMAPRHFPTNKELYTLVKNQDKEIVPPVRNMRHINPVRQSGVIPSYFGPYTMEDKKRIWEQTTLSEADYHYCQMDPQQIMRRVPGITRAEVDEILLLGLPPNEQIECAYIVYNTGLDIFYEGNQVYLARQVVTNSKGQKVEVFFLPAVAELQEFLVIGFSPTLDTFDYHWEIFLWGEVPLKVTGDMDLGVPDTFYQYEIQWSEEATISMDQMNLPEVERPFNTPRNPHCTKELWKSQEQLKMEAEMRDPEWKLPRDI